jgi:DNA-binding CsgD family transcriptional regulator
MIAIEAFSELLPVLYSAPLQQEQWQRFLTLLCRQTQSLVGIYLFSDVRSGLGAAVESVSKEYVPVLVEYNRTHSQSDPFRLPIFRRNQTGVFTDDELLPNGGLYKTGLYRDLCEPVHFRHLTITIINLSVRQIDIVSIWRTDEQGPMEPDSKRLLELLIPHIRIALEIRRTLGIAQQRTARAEAMADANATATFLLTEQGRVAHANAAAHSLLRDDGGLMLLNERLSPSDSASRAAWANLLRNAAAPSYSLADTQPHHALALPRPGGKAPLQLLAMPLPEAQRNSTRADLLLLATNPDDPIHFPDAVLRALYGLTPAETEVANGLLMAYSAEEIACLRRVSTGTVRQQIKAMMSKTGSSRQSEMIRLFMTLPQSPQCG